MIYSSNLRVLRFEQIRELQRIALNREKQKATHPGSSAQGEEDVRISEVVRPLATRGTNGSRDELTPERIAQFRERIISGTYDSFEVADQVARKMLASRDI